MQRRQLTFVTGNPKKLEEFKAIMGIDLPIGSANVNRAFIGDNSSIAYRHSS